MRKVLVLATCAAALLASGLAPAPVRAADGASATEAERPANAWRRWGTRVEEYLDNEWVPESWAWSYDRWGRAYRYRAPGYWRQVRKTRQVEGWIEETPARQGSPPACATATASGPRTGPRTSRWRS